MGLRDRIIGIGKRTAMAVGAAAGAIQSAAIVAAGKPDAANTDERLSTPPTQQSRSPVENFNPLQQGLDAEGLTRAMREGTWDGQFVTARGPLDGPPIPGLGQSYTGLPAGGMPQNGSLFTDSVPLWKATGNLSDGDSLVPTRPAGDDPKALYWDPFALVQQLGFRERPSSVTYATLNSMVWRVPIVQAILQTRINQASSFATPQHYKFETGFRVKMRDPEAKPTNADKRFIKQMERMILNCGVETGNYSNRDSFETFLRKIIRDSLTYDQANFEVVPGGDGRPAEWYAVDAATIRLADTARLYPDDDPERVKTVQIYDNVIIAEFTAPEMAFMVRNPRTDIRSYGYGTSELEMVVSTVTAILWAWHYNQNFFSQGSVAKGLLNLKGAIPEKQLRAFRRQWYQMVSGVENAWRTPITNAEEVQWVDMHTSNRDMEFSAWMDFLIKVVSSVYVMDPVEINFKYGSGGGQKAMFEGANRAKSQESRERGLKPLLRAVGREIDRNILWPINPEFTMEFVGLESQTPKELADLMTQRVRTTYTINEIRAENDQHPLPDGLGDIILDANWMNARNQLITQKREDEQAAQQAQLQQQQMQQQTQAAGGGVGELEAMLAQLQGKPPKPGAGPSGSGPGGTGAPQGGAQKPVKDTQTYSSKPSSTPSQTPKQIANELGGEGTAPIEASLKSPSDLKKSVIEFTL